MCQDLSITQSKEKEIQTVHSSVIVLKHYIPPHTQSGCHIKKGLEPEKFYEYTVYPLEGIWDISEKAKQSFDGTIYKNELVYTLMIRQPDFVTQAYAEKVKEWALKKKNNPLIEGLTFSELADGKCVQMMHLGSYDKEQDSFDIMEAFCSRHHLKRKSKQHKEIYIFPTQEK